MVIGDANLNIKNLATVDCKHYEMHGTLTEMSFDSCDAVRIGKMKQKERGSHLCGGFTNFGYQVEFWSTWNKQILEKIIANDAVG